MYLDDLATICAGLGLLCLAPFLFWITMYLAVGWWRRVLDTRLTTVRLGLNEMPISRKALEEMASVPHLLTQAVETTRRKPLDELQTLIYVPRLSENNSGVGLAQEEASMAIPQILGSIDDVLTNGTNRDWEETLA